MKYIVIRKELYESMMNMLKENDKISIHIQTTEIDTDQSIDERAKKYAESLGISKKDKRYSQYIEDAIKDYTQGATEQDLISKAREGEFAEWIAENDYIRSTNELWYYKSDGEIEKGITTKELLIKFTNR